ncbi:MAG: diaminopropionate ammonia-lyase [Alphaproteobacteria bacterium]|nr:diaminopropionate ammonia-lyase [Alphaproteobacteria bacterium]
MTRALASHGIDVFTNPRAVGAAPFGAQQAAILDRQGHAQAMAEMAAWPGYAETPLVSLDGLAARAGFDRIWYKDEGGRFGLGSFKALGGAYAVFRLLAKAIAERTGATDVTAADIVSGRYRDIVSGITVTCATDGNHGRSVAWGANLFGSRCVIYIHATVSQSRQEAIAALGAEVVRTPGNYDDSVRVAAADAETHSRFVVSDTSYDGYMDVPRDVMQGYTVMAAEALEQLPEGERPTHIFVQGGVGGLAAAICAHVWDQWGTARPRFVIVEPDQADCLYQSARNGGPTVVTGALDTIMAGLACGEVSPLAWDILDAGADAFATISDAAAADCMRLLASPAKGDTPIVAGESAVAGLAGALIARGSDTLSKELNLDGNSRLLVFGSEGATDPAMYEKIVGRSADAVRSKAGGSA